MIRPVEIDLVQAVRRPAWFGKGVQGVSTLVLAAASALTGVHLLVSTPFHTNPFVAVGATLVVVGAFAARKGVVALSPEASPRPVTAAPTTAKVLARTTDLEKPFLYTVTGQFTNLTWMVAFGSVLVALAVVVPTYAMLTGLGLVANLVIGALLICLAGVLPLLPHRLYKRNATEAAAVRFRSDMETAEVVELFADAVDTIPHYDAAISYDENDGVYDVVVVSPKGVGLDEARLGAALEQVRD